MKARDLFGKEVIDADARVVGKIEDCELDISKASVLGIVVRSGFKRRLLVLPQDVVKIGDKIVLKITADKIRKA
ncbi:MAG: photosystem reaction center subunit H [Chloroflexi bacterium]|nr:photosystem reaction center subunit H [Chloroflexota bacterium]MBM3167030.1 photosystem reaction center subunit H [Chloroflexota bacterium]MBM3182461.1 photosystem reaction center subunit H [Chloroflexota bacterium]MBM4452482.1 photosystem reaction center subunit H [Chloroflexota bacterium]